DVYAPACLGDRWLAPVELPASGGRNDMRISSQRDRAGGAYFAYASDNRGWLMGMTPRNHHVAVSRFAGAPKPGPMRLAEKQREYPVAAPCHPREAEQVARVRAYKGEAGAPACRGYRPDPHPPTAPSTARPGDPALRGLRP